MQKILEFSEILRWIKMRKFFLFFFLDVKISGEFCCCHRLFTELSQLTDFNWQAQVDKSPAAFFQNSSPPAATFFGRCEGEAATAANTNMLFHLKGGAARWPGRLLWHLFSQQENGKTGVSDECELVCIQKPRDSVDLQWRSRASGALSWLFIVRMLSKQNGCKAHKSYLLPCYRLAYCKQWGRAIYSLKLEWL